MIKAAIFNLCTKLAQNGWRELLHSVTNNQLDIQQTSPDALVAELLKPLGNNLNRTIQGFEGYRLDGNQGITPFSFSKSLLYHALASSNVVDPSITYYPSLNDLDIVENFIYSVNMQHQGTSRSLSSLKDQYGTKLVVAVFAYQYRTSEGSSHQVHADMNYSLTGISRIGTNDAIYDKQRRSFWVGDIDGAISVLPCRYAAFIAIRDTGNNLKDSFSIMDTTDSDNSLKFITPIHKLFNGDECLSDINNLKLDYETYHRNEKLKKTHDPSIANTIPIHGYELNKFPFIIDDHTNKGFLYSVDHFEGSFLIKPTNGPIVEPAIQDNRYVAFNVPKINAGNRFNSSFQIPARSGRQAPEYLNIRQVVKSVNISDPATDIQDINELPLNDFNQLLNDGGYLAVDFIDRTADGFIKLKKFDNLPSVSAYSIITTIDFFPLVNQRAIYSWDNSDSIWHFFQGSPKPLSDGRLRANINYAPFLSDEIFTHPSVVSDKPSIQESTNLKENDSPSISYLPDGASNIFAPGWDVSIEIKNNTAFYSAYGLGSPFAEDAKLCAALNSFWPAAAPDASRTFFVSRTLKANILNSGAFDNQFNRKKPTAIPLTDKELGIYPRQANLLGEQATMGWDGEYGPFIETIGPDEFVNYADIARSDYTFNAWKGLMNMDLLKKVTTAQLIKRMEVLQKCILELLPPSDDTITDNHLWLVSFQEIDDWSTENDKMDNQLKGQGFRFIFVTPKQGATPSVDVADIKRLRMPIDKKYKCQLDEDTFVWRELTKVNTIALNVDIPMVNFISQGT